MKCVIIARVCFANIAGLLKYGNDDVGYQSLKQTMSSLFNNHTPIFL